jgi:hypothetical protein
MGEGFDAFTHRKAVLEKRRNSTEIPALREKFKKNGKENPERGGENKFAHDIRKKTGNCKPKQSDNRADQREIEKHKRRFRLLIMAMGTSPRERNFC